MGQSWSAFLDVDPPAQRIRKEGTASHFTLSWMGNCMRRTLPTGWIDNQVRALMSKLS